MNPYSTPYKYVDDIIKLQQEYNLSEQEIVALEKARVALLLVELLVLSLQTETKKTI